MAVWVPSGPQKQRLRQALIAAFDQQALTLLVSDYFAPEAFPAIATDGSFEFRVHTLIEHARMNDWLLDLLAAARERRPRNAALAALAEEIGLAAAGARLDNPTGRSLEEIVRTHARFINPAAFRETMAVLEGQVCWVDVPGGGGTGFLVGPDLVLTNEHVIRRLTTGQASWRDTTCVFDFKEGARGEAVDRKKLTRVGLEPNGQWLVSSRPPSTFDDKPELGEPAAEQVDYALLRLAERIGELPVGGDTPDDKAEPRGWIKVPSPPPTLQAGQQVFLLQHPRGTRCACPWGRSRGSMQAGLVCATTPTAATGRRGRPCSTPTCGWSRCTTPETPRIRLPTTRPSPCPHCCPCGGRIRSLSAEEARVLLSGAEMARLSREIERQLTLDAFTLHLSNIGLDLGAIAPDGSLYKRAYDVLVHVQQLRPPRTRDLLQAMQTWGNSEIRSVATEILTPQYFSPTNDPIDATLIGRAAFVNRRDLRDAVRNFAQYAPGTSHLLVVRGTRPCGKSYTWEYLRHLAVSIAGARPQRVQLARQPFATPRALVEHVALLLDLPLQDLPPLTDDPQLARIDSLIAWFKGKVHRLAMPYWLVIDDLNDQRVERSIREAAFALAFAIEETQPPNLRVVLLGYNDPLSDPELRYVAQEQAQFPTTADVSAHLEALAASVQQPLAPGFADALAARLCAPFTALPADAPLADVKAAMLAVTVNIERAGEKIRGGLQP